MLRRFDNQTTVGNEKAVRRGNVVPQDAVNLAYYKTPKLNPEDNIIIVDTSRVIEQNTLDTRNRRKIYYANALGVLVDADGNTVVGDQYPAVTDVFSVDEDWSRISGTEYTDDTILPYVHRSRHFHIDFAGLTMGSETLRYDTQAIKVVDGTGKEYLNSDGSRRYRASIVGAKIPSAQTSDNWAYRVYAYVDTDENEDLYLVYNKVEIATDGTFKGQRTAYRELLNPQPIFDYRPEESEVVDPANRDEKIFSTKLISEKNRMLGRPTASEDGYQIYVPRKAISDPRVFQPFRWRINTKFTRQWKVDPTRSPVVKAGFVITRQEWNTLNVPSRSVFSLLNLERSKYNVNGVRFQNPQQGNHTDVERENPNYWFVFIDDPAYDLTEYDLLIWAPNRHEYDFTPWRAKLDDFTSKKGTLLVDTANFCRAKGLGPSFSHPVVPSTGQSLIDGSRSTDNLAGYSKVKFTGSGSLSSPNPDHELFKGLDRLGGWNIETHSGIDPEILPPLGVYYSLPDGRKALRLETGGIEPTWVLVDGPHQAVEAERVYGPITPYGTNIDPARFQNLDGSTRDVPSFFGMGGIRLYGDLSGTAGARSPSSLPPLGIHYSLPDGKEALRLETGGVEPTWVLVGGPYQAEEATRVYGPATPYGTIIDEARFKNVDGSTRDVPSFFGMGGIRQFADLSGTAESRLPRATDLDTMTYIQSVNDPGYCHRISIEIPPHFKVLLNGKDSITGGPRPVTIAKETTGGGYEILTSLGQTVTCHYYMTISAPASVVSQNSVSVRYSPLNPSGRMFPHPNADKYVNSIYVEGAMKFMFNVAMMAVKNKALDDSDEQTYSTTFTLSTPWESSWVVNGDVLDPQERDLYQFTQQPRDLLASTPDLTHVWKRKLSERTVDTLVNEVLDPLMRDPVRRAAIEGARRSYSIEITNPYVKIASVVNQSDYPSAWTEAYSPEFVIPSDLGPHIIKEEERLGKYNQNAQYLHRQYPDKPYACQVTATHIATEEDGATREILYTARGTAKETTQTTGPATVTPGTTAIATLNWWNNPRGGSRNWRTPSPYDAADPMKRPTGIHTWQEHNYYTSNWGNGHLNWPYFGLRGNLSVGDKGEKVSFVQAALNFFIKRGYLNAGKLKVDGKYGSETKNVVRKLQNQLNARYKDGIVDAESWYLIGSQIIRGKNHLKDDINIKDSNYTRFFKLPQKYMAWENISDGSPFQVWGKQSWLKGGPNIIWDLVMVVFDQVYDLHGVTIEPFIADDSKTQSVWVRAVDVRKQPFTLNGYDADRSMMKNMEYRPKDGEKLKINFPSPVKGDTIILGLGQDRTAWGTARHFGIRDLQAHAKVTVGPTTNPSTIQSTTKIINIKEEKWTQVTAFKPEIIQLQATEKSGGTLSDIQWTSIELSDPNVTATLTPQGRLTLTHEIVTRAAATQVTKGRFFPFDIADSSAYYAMDTDGRVFPNQETGFVSKVDGIKLLCDANGKPVGFPTMPTNSGSTSSQRHYTKIAIASTGSAAEVMVAFYDKAQKEFIRTPNGRAEMTYIEYMLRGPENIYIGVVSDYELVESRTIPTPSDQDAPRLPFKWAMPAYGVLAKEHSRISLQPLPKNLGAQDLWPVAVREGRFNRQLVVPRTGNLPAYLQSYRGSRVNVFYGLPEAEMGGYSSSIYGPPHADVHDEEPIILDDNVIQVRQAPIHMVETPTQFPSRADPVRPVFKVYKRLTTSSPWVQLEWSDILDWNVSTGEIFLRQPLRSNDTSLLKVDYTTTRRHYYFKKFNNTLLNLNMHPGHSRTFQDKALYVYLVPEYAEDSKAKTIPGSVNASALRMTTDPAIFDPIDPRFDPLAVQLGVIYTSAALDHSSIAVLDTRRRGGGIPNETNLSEVVRLIKQASTYWDVGFGAGASYQKGGYVIVRLPSELKQDFSEQQLREVIERNMTVGVGFKVEDLQGNDWS